MEEKILTVKRHCFAKLEEQHPDYFRTLLFMKM